MKRLSRTTLPSTATLAALLTSCVEKKVPLVSGHDRISGSSTSVPWMRVPQFWLPATICARVLTPSERYCTPGSWRMASASASVSVAATPWPERTPPCVQLPADTMIMLVPADLICCSIESCAPRPSATIVITAATPMIIPSIVSVVRILLRFSAFNATRNVMRTDMSGSAFSGLWDGRGVRRHDLIDRRRQVGQFLFRVPAIGDRPIEDDASIAETDEARGVLRNVEFVRDHQDGDAALHVEALEDAHPLDAGARVEIAGR